MKKLKERDGKKLLFKIWHHLSKKRKTQLIMMTLLMILNSFAEVISLASIIPFLTLLSNPSRIMEMKYIHVAHQSSPSSIHCLTNQLIVIVISMKIMVQHGKE